MQSLPTALTTKQLDGILASLQGLPSAQITRHSDVATVHATRKATGEKVKVLSAITRNGTQWHVMAVQGLISTTFTN
jgi:hypothetical protein